MEQGRPISNATRELARAEAQLRLSELLAERWKNEAGDAPRMEATRALFLAAQQQFAWYCRLASYHLAMQPDPGDNPGLKGPGPALRLEALRHQNSQLTGQKELNQLRRQAEKQVADANPTVAPLTLPDRGTPHFWQATTAPLKLRLMPLAEERQRQALGASLLLIAGLALIGLLRNLGRVAAARETCCRNSWCCWRLVGNQVFSGVSLVAVGLLILGVGARLVLLTLAVQRLWKRTPAQPLPAGSSPGTTSHSS